MNTEIWLAVIAIAGSVITAVVTNLITRGKYEMEIDRLKQEAKGVEIDNDEKSLQIVYSYIVEPLKKEINALRRDVRKLQRAIDEISDCPHAADCPVRYKLQDSENEPEG